MQQGSSLLDWDCTLRLQKGCRAAYREMVYTEMARKISRDAARPEASQSARAIGTWRRAEFRRNLATNWSNRFPQPQKVKHRMTQAVCWLNIKLFECCKKLSHILITHSSQYSLSEHSLKAICNLQWSPPCCVHKRLPGYLRQCWFHYRGEKLVLQYTYSLFTITYYFPKHLNAFLVKSE